MKIKAFIAVVLAVCLMAASFGALSAFAADAVKGDADGDGKVTSADARLILRYSVGLEPGMTKERLALCDVDGSGVVDAADAREILRVAIGADKGFDNAGTTKASATTEPVTESTSAEDAMTVLSGSRYYIIGSVYSAQDNTTAPVELAVDGGNIYVASTYQNVSIAMMGLNGDFYLISPAKKLYCVPTATEKKLMKTMGMDADAMIDSMKSLAAATASGSKTDSYTAEKDGSQYKVDVFTTSDGGKNLIWYKDGVLSRSDIYGSDNKLLYTIGFDKVTSSIPSGLLADPSGLGYSKVLFTVFIASLSDISLTDISDFIKGMIAGQSSTVSGETTSLIVIDPSKVIDDLIPDDIKNLIPSDINGNIPSDVSDLSIKSLLPSEVQSLIDKMPSDISDLDGLIPDSIRGLIDKFPGSITGLLGGAYAK